MAGFNAAGRGVGAAIARVGTGVCIIHTQLFAQGYHASAPLGIQSQR